MPRVIFDNGMVVNFEKPPSKRDIEDAARQLKILPPSSSSTGTKRGGLQRDIKALGVEPYALRERQKEQLRNNKKSALQSIGERSGKILGGLYKYSGVESATDLTLTAGRGFAYGVNRLYGKSKEEARRSIGGDRFMTNIEKITAEEGKRAGLKSVAGKALDVALMGFPLAKGAKVAKPLLKRGVIKLAGEGAAYGAGFAASESLKEGETPSTKELAIGGIFGGILNGVIGGTSKFLISRVTKENAVKLYMRGLNSGKEKYKETGKKVIPKLLALDTKRLGKEGWDDAATKEWGNIWRKKWGTFNQLMEKVDAGIELTGKEYEKMGKLEGNLIVLRGVRDKDLGVTDKFLNEEHGVSLLAKIGKKIESLTRPDGKPISSARAGVKALENVRDDIMGYTAYTDILETSHGTIYSTSAPAEALRKLAKEYGDELYATRKSFKTVSDSKTLSKVKEADGLIRKLLNEGDYINAGFPEYGKINRLYHLNTELKDIIIDTVNRKSGQKVIGLLRGMSLSGGATYGAVASNLKGGVLLAAISLGVVELVNSTWFLTLSATQLNSLAKLLGKHGQENTLLIINKLLKYGLKGFDKVTKEVSDAT